MEIAHRQALWLVTRTLVALLSLSLLLGSGFAWAAYRTAATNLTTTPFVPTKPSRSGLKVDGKDQNIMLLGDDSRAGATPAELAELGTSQDSGNDTDTIMLLHLPADGRSASLMSFPRDSLVTPAGGQGQVKINSIYANDGVQALATTISNLTGLSVTHYIKIGMLGFDRISKAIHGINIDMCEAQNLSTDSDSTAPLGYTGINLKQGWNYNVQGHQAVAFVRQRHGPGLSDYTRIARQRYFLAAAFRKLDSAAVLADPTELLSLLNAVSSSLTTDEGLQGTKLLTVAEQMRSLAAANFKLATIPMIGAVGQGDSYQGEQVDTDALPAFVAGFVGQPSAYESARPVPRGSVTVTVVNGGRAAGSAAASAAALAALGFKATPSEANATSATTVIDYPNGMQAQAKTLAAAVPGAVPVLTHTVSSVQLILGTDQAHVSSLPAPVVPTPAASATAPASASASPPVATAADPGCIV